MSTQKMAFIPVLGVLLRAPSHSRLSPVFRRHSHTNKRTSTTRMVDTESVGPVAPEGFEAPEPRLGYVRPDNILNVATGALASLARAGAGALIEGHKVSFEDGTMREYSATLSKTRPREPIRFFEFEACPFCRKVREAVCMLDLDVLMFPCPKGGSVYRKYVEETGGKAQFPYMEDPNTGFKSYESDDIISYLYSTYGPQDARVPFVFNRANTLTAGLATGFRGGKGGTRESKTVPAKIALELYGYEPSPFSKIVRERLCELELPYKLYTTPRGSPTRQALKELTGRIQTPYLIDPNTGVKMFESVDIVEYLTKTYGPNAPGAVESLDGESTYLPPFGPVQNTSASIVETTAPTEETTTDASAPEKSLNPQQEEDKTLEEYCKENPESDECRVYEE